MEIEVEKKETCMRRAAADEDSLSAPDVLWMRKRVNNASTCASSDEPSKRIASSRLLHRAVTSASSALLPVTTLCARARLLSSCFIECTSISFSSVTAQASMPKRSQEESRPRLVGTSRHGGVSRPRQSTCMPSTQAIGRWRMRSVRAPHIPCESPTYSGVRAPHIPGSFRHNTQLCRHGHSARDRHSALSPSLHVKH